MDKRLAGALLTLKVSDRQKLRDCTVVGTLVIKEPVKRKVTYRDKQ